MPYAFIDTFRSPWFLAIVCLLTIPIIVLLISRRNRKAPINKKEILKESIDFDNIINSSFHAEKIWDELRKKCHPDRFSGDQDKVLIASEIQALINQNKTNLNELAKLKKRAEEELGIEFTKNKS